MSKNRRIKKKYGGRERAISIVLIIRITRLLAAFLLIVWLGVSLLRVNTTKRENEKMLGHVLDNLDEAVTGYLDNTLIGTVYSILSLGPGEDDKPLLDLEESDFTDINGDGRIGVEEVNEYLKRIKKAWFCEEINIINPDGVIIYSSNDDNIGWDMKSSNAESKQDSEFFEKTRMSGLFIQDTTERASDKKSIKYVGLLFEKDCWVAKEGSVLEVGWMPDQMEGARLDDACVFVANASIGTYGNYLVLKKEPEVDGTYKVYGKKGMLPYRSVLRSVKDEYISFPAYTEPVRNMFTYDYYGTKCYCMYDQESTFIYAALIPKKEVYSKVNSRNIQFLIAILISFGLMGTMVLVMIRKEVIRPIHRLNEGLVSICEGNLDVRMDVTNNVEFSMLSDDINIMVLTLKKYIKEAKSRIDKELALAKAIQISAIPHVFPPYPDRKEFEIYAFMDTAKEVGGDFYDFFFIDDDHLVLVMADVSNKGIPAAMFMMQVKAGIRGRALQGGKPAEILTDVNNELCGANDEKMFVTLWMGVIEISTGKVLEANAGHEHPALYRNESYRLVKYPHSPPLAVMPGIPIVDREFILEPGEKLFVYTDGVTEAQNEEQEMFGEQRLVDALNECSKAGCEETIRSIKSAIDSFVDGAEQFDDITMCSFTYYGQPKDNRRN